jgi:predicted ATPase/class 3 adenylate cyclase
MPELPSGTVTFLFTDVERSTESVAALGDERYADLLDVHRGLLRQAFLKHGGVEVGTEGDAFFVAFVRAQDAVKASVEGQCALESHDWPGETRLRVRMGLHTGEALVRGDDYVGHEVHRAKRISDAGHGGQILLSETTADLVRASAKSIDLGPHRLKDLGEPQRIYQVVDESLPQEFPRLRSLESFTHSLPLQRSAFIGREREIAEIRELLAANRIVTLTGVGGCGKTRLALQVGAEELDAFADGVFLAALAPVSDPDVVAREIAAAVGVSLGAAATPGTAGPGGPIDQILLDFLSQRDCLVVLDNCEHLLDACAEITDSVLARCPKVKILATSREGLRVEGEQSWVVPSLSIPDETSRAQESESVSLFKARAKAVRPAFELTPDNLGPVVEICRRLDGIPLAIEFAAARVAHLSPRQIADRLDDRFRLLTGGQRRVQRQQTLQAALDWSFELLDDSEGALLRRLSVFLGDFAIEGAEGVCSDDHLDARAVTDLLGSLVSKSLVEADPTADVVRYRLLETVRAYCAERLAHAGEAQIFRARHRDWYLAWLESVPWDVTIFDIEHGRRIGAEFSNIRAALEWSAGEGRNDLVARISCRTSTLWGFALVGEAYRDRDHWIRLALQAPDLDPDMRMACLYDASVLSMALVDAPRMLELASVPVDDEAAPELRSRLAGAQSIFNTLRSVATRDPELAETAIRDLDRAALALTDRAPEWLAYLLFQRGAVEMMLRTLEEAELTFDECHRLFRSSTYPLVADWAAPFRWTTAFALGHLDKAMQAFADGQRNALARIRSVDDPEFWPVGFMAPVAVMHASVDGVDAAWEFLARQRSRVLRSGLPGALADLALACASVSALAGDHVRAAVLRSAVRANTFDRGIPVSTPVHWVLYLHFRDIGRQALNADDARRARDEGSGMSLEEAIDLGLSDRVVV